MPGFDIGMINDDFHIAGIRQVVAERLKRVVVYSMALGPRCFKWKMLSLSGLVSIEEVFLPSFEVLNCWLNLVASCLDDENEIPLKVIASFSASRFALPSIPLIVLHSLVRSVCLLVHGFNKVSPYLPFVHTDAVLDGFIQSWQFR